MRLLLSRCTLDPRHPLDPKALDAHNRTAFDYIEAHLRLEGHTPDEFAALRACREVLVLCGGLRHVAIDAKGAAAALPGAGGRHEAEIEHVGTSKKPKTEDELAQLGRKHEAARQKLADELLIGRRVVLGNDRVVARVDEMVSEQTGTGKLKMLGMKPAAAASAKSPDQYFHKLSVQPPDHTTEELRALSSLDPPALSRAKPIAVSARLLNAKSSSGAITAAVKSSDFAPMMKSPMLRFSKPNVLYELESKWTAAARYNELDKPPRPGTLDPPREGALWKVEEWEFALEIEEVFWSQLDSAMHMTAEGTPLAPPISRNRYWAKDRIAPHGPEAVASAGWRQQPRQSKRRRHGSRRDRTSRRVPQPIEEEKEDAEEEEAAPHVREVEWSLSSMLGFMDESAGGDAEPAAPRVKPRADAPLRPNWREVVVTDPHSENYNKVYYWKAHGRDKGATTWVRPVVKKAKSKRREPKAKPKALPPAPPPKPKFDPTLESNADWHTSRKWGTLTQKGQAVAPLTREERQLAQLEHSVSFVMTLYDKTLDDFNATLFESAVADGLGLRRGAVTITAMRAGSVVVEATVTLGDAQAAQIVSELVRERASSRFLLDPKDFGNYEVSDITVIGGADAEPREVDSEPEYDARPISPCCAPDEPTQGSLFGHGHHQFVIPLFCAQGGDDEYDYYPEPEEKVADDEDDELDDEDAPAEDLADKSIEDVLKDLRSKQELRSKQAAAPRSDGDEGSEEEKDKEPKEKDKATAGPATDYQRLDLKNAKASRRFLTSSRGLIRRGSSSVPLYTGDPPPTMAPGAAGAMHVRGRDQMVSASFEGTGSDRDIMQLQGSQAGRAVHEDVRVPAAKMRKVDKMNVDRTKGANKQEYTNGEKALALTDDGAWRMGRVTQCHRGGEYDIRYDDGPGAAHTSAKTVKAKSVGRMFTHLPDVALLVGDESDDDEDEFDERGRVIHPSERTSAEFLLCGDVVVSSPRRRRRHGPRKIWVHATLQFTKLRISHFSVAQRAHLQTLIATATRRKNHDVIVEKVEIATIRKEVLIDINKEVPAKMKVRRPGVQLVHLNGQWVERAPDGGDSHVEVDVPQGTMPGDTFEVELEDIYAGVMVTLAIRCQNEELALVTRDALFVSPASDVPPPIVNILRELGPGDGDITVRKQSVSATPGKGDIGMLDDDDDLEIVGARMADGSMRAGLLEGDDEGYEDDEFSLRRSIASSIRGMYGRRAEREIDDDGEEEREMDIRYRESMWFSLLGEAEPARRAPRASARHLSQYSKRPRAVPLDHKAPKAVTFDVLMRELDLRSFDSAQQRFFERAVADALRVQPRDVIIRAARAASVLASVQVYESSARRASDIEQAVLACEVTDLPLNGFGDCRVSNVRIINAKKMKDYELDAMRDIDVTREDVIKQFEDDREAIDAKAAYRKQKDGLRPETERELMEFDYYTSIRRTKSDSDSEREMEDIRRRYHRADQIEELNAALAQHEEERKRKREEQKKLDALQSQWFESRREGGGLTEGLFGPTIPEEEKTDEDRLREQNALSQRLADGAQVAGTVVAGIAVLPLAIVASPFYAGYYCYDQANEAAKADRIMREQVERQRQEEEELRERQEANMAAYNVINRLVGSSELERMRRGFKMWVQKAEHAREQQRKRLESAANIARDEELSRLQAQRAERAAFEAERREAAERTLMAREDWEQMRAEDLRAALAAARADAAAKRAAHAERRLMGRADRESRVLSQARKNVVLIRVRAKNLRGLLHAGGATRGVGGDGATSTSCFLTFESLPSKDQWRSVIAARVKHAAAHANGELEETEAAALFGEPITGTPLDGDKATPPSRVAWRSEGFVVRDAALDEPVWPAPRSNHGPPITVSAPHGAAAGDRFLWTLDRRGYREAAAAAQLRANELILAKAHASVVTPPPLLTPTLHPPLEFEITVPSRFNHQISRHFKWKPPVQPGLVSVPLVELGRGDLLQPLLVCCWEELPPTPAHVAARAYRQTVYSARAPADDDVPPRRLIGCHVTSLAEMHTACDYRLEVPLTLSADEAADKGGAPYARKNVEAPRSAGGVVRMGTLLIEHLELALDHNQPNLDHLSLTQLDHALDDIGEVVDDDPQVAAALLAEQTLWAKRRQRELDRGFFAPKRIGQTPARGPLEDRLRQLAKVVTCSANSAILEGRYVRGNVLEVSLAFARGAVAQAVEPADEMRHVFIVVNQLEPAAGDGVVSSTRHIIRHTDDAQPPLKVREEIWRSKPVKVTRATRVAATHGHGANESAYSSYYADAGRQSSLYVFERVALPLVPLCDGDLDRPMLVRCFELKQSPGTYARPHKAEAALAGLSVISLSSDIDRELLREFDPAIDEDEETAQALLAGLWPKLIGYRSVTVRDMLATPVGSEIALAGPSSANDDLGGVVVRDAHLQVRYDFPDFSVVDGIIEREPTVEFDEPESPAVEQPAPGGAAPPAPEAALFAGAPPAKCLDELGPNERIVVAKPGKLGIKFSKAAAENGQKVVEVVEGSQLAGQIRRDDVITAIDSVPTSTQTYEEISDYLVRSHERDRVLTVWRKLDADEPPDMADLEQEERDRLGAASSFMLSRMLAGFLTGGEGPAQCGQAEPNALAVRLRAHGLPAEWCAEGAVLSIRVQQRVAKASAAATGRWPAVKPHRAFASKEDRIRFAGLAPLYEQWRAGKLSRDALKALDDTPLHEGTGLEWWRWVELMAGIADHLESPQAAPAFSAQSARSQRPQIEVWRSEVVRATTEPSFSLALVSLEMLCYTNLDRPLIIRCEHHGQAVYDDVPQFFELTTSVRRLQQAQRLQRSLEFEQRSDAEDASALSVNEVEICYFPPHLLGLDATAVSPKDTLTMYEPEPELPAEDDEDLNACCDDSCAQATVCPPEPPEPPPPIVEEPEPDPSLRTFVAPPGRLEVFFHPASFGADEGHEVAGVKSTSPIASFVQIGDVIVAVNDEPTAHLGPSEIQGYLLKRFDDERVISVRPSSAPPVDVPIDAVEFDALLTELELGTFNRRKTQEFERAVAETLGAPPSGVVVLSARAGSVALSVRAYARDADDARRMGDTAGAAMLLVPVSVFGACQVSNIQVVKAARLPQEELDAIIAANERARELASKPVAEPVTASARPAADDVMRDTEEFVQNAVPVTADDAVVEELFAEEPPADEPEEKLDDDDDDDELDDLDDDDDDDDEASAMQPPLRLRSTHPQLMEALARGYAAPCRVRLVGAEGGDSWKHRPLTEREIERIGEVLLGKLASAQQGSADSSASAQEAAAEASEAAMLVEKRPAVLFEALLAEEPVAVQARSWLAQSELAAGLEIDRSIMAAAPTEAMPVSTDAVSDAAAQQVPAAPVAPPPTTSAPEYDLDAFTARLHRGVVIFKYDASTMSKGSLRRSFTGAATPTAGAAKKRLLFCDAAVNPRFLRWRSVPKGNDNAMAAAASKGVAISDLVEVRTARDPDPTKAGSKGTPVLRRYGVVDNPETERLAFSLLFSNGRDTLDLRTETHDDYVFLLQGFRFMTARQTGGTV